MVRAFVSSEARISIVAQASHGADAVDAVHSARPDVVLMDVEMPIMDGIQATRTIKGRWPKTVVLGFTASLDEQGRNEMLAAGASAVLDKCCPMDEVLAAILTHASVDDSTTDAMATPTPVVTA